MSRKSQLPKGSPPEWTNERIGTSTIHVPVGDWEEVIAGRKTEFRQSTPLVLPPPTDTPRPTWAYTQNYAGVWVGVMMVNMATWAEQLGAISPESLAREGFADLPEFRRYWLLRVGTYRPLDTVKVVRLRPWAEGDDEAMAAWVFGRLYGHLPR